MDDEGQRGGPRRACDNFREQSPWNMVAYQHQIREQNALNMNRNLLNIMAERDAAVEEMKVALLEKKRALEERELAVSQRNMAIKELDEAIIERNNAYNTLQNSLRQPLSPGVQCGANRVTDLPFITQQMQIFDALCRAAVPSDCNKPPQTKKRKKCVRKPREKQTSDHLKVKNDWDGQNVGLNRVDYDGTVMPAPGCSCTGVFRQCYKWGEGGWQSACCTTTMSAYPLPAIPNKRYARLGGRKMSGSAFSKLLSGLASEGYDFSNPVDLKDRWSKHGTNRYISIK